MLKRLFLLAATGSLLAMPVAGQPDVAATYPNRLTSLILTNCDVHDGWPPPQPVQVRR